MNFLEKNFVVGSFQCNCRLLVCPTTGKGVLIDPGDEPDRLIESLEQTQLPSGMPLQIEYLMHTHAHLDHIGATREVAMSLRKKNDSEESSEKAKTGVRIALHKEDHPLYLNLKVQGSLFGMNFEEPLGVDHFIEDEEEIQVGSLKLAVVHTPGHSPGSVCFRLSEDSGLGVPETLYSGDTLFKGSVGRTDLWGADQDTMFSSIQRRLLTLDDDTRVCAGHGPDSTIGLERSSNPFLVSLKA